MNVRVWAVLFILTAARVSLAQGFAGLGTDAEEFSVPTRGVPFEFPADHGAHPTYRIEWWYLTAALSGNDGRPYGVQWTLFRSALKPRDGAGWRTPQLWMGHAALTTPDMHLFDERIARGGIGQAGVTPDPFRAWIDDWQMIGRPGEGLSDLAIMARGDGFSYDLTLRAATPLVLHGEDGYSVKSAQGQSSYYYSQPGYEVSGTLTLPGGSVEVTGQGWLDREWSSQPLSENQTGWDWFSLSFESGARMMGFRLRDDDKGYTSATWIFADGSSQSLQDGALHLEPLEISQVEDRAIPTRWKVSLPEHDVDIEVSAVNPQSWMGTSFPYWEGPVTVTGSHSGRGYLEMTGYE